MFIFSLLPPLCAWQCRKMLKRITPIFLLFFPCWPPLLPPESVPCRTAHTWRLYGESPHLAPVALVVKNKTLISSICLSYYMAFFFFFFKAQMIKIQIFIFLGCYAKCMCKFRQVCSRFRNSFVGSTLVSISLHIFNQIGKWEVPWVVFLPWALTVTFFRRLFPLRWKQYFRKIWNISLITPVLL